MAVKVSAGSPAPLLQRTARSGQAASDWGPSLGPCALLCPQGPRLSRTVHPAHHASPALPPLYPSCANPPAPAALQEISHHPFVRDWVRKIYFENALLSTKCTSKGVDHPLMEPYAK